MKSETDLQHELLVAWEEWLPTNWGRKLSNSFTSGIPDLLLSGYGGPYIIEIKKISKLPVRETTVVTFDHPLTALQNQTLIRLRRGGTYAGWWAIHRTFHEDGILVGLTQADADTITMKRFIEKCVIRKRGQHWGEVFPFVLQEIRLGHH